MRSCHLLDVRLNDFSLRVAGENRRVSLIMGECQIGKLRTGMTNCSVFCLLSCGGLECKGLEYKKETKWRVLVGGHIGILVATWGLLDKNTSPRVPNIAPLHHHHHPFTPIPFHPHSPLTPLPQFFPLSSFSVLLTLKQRVFLFRPPLSF